MLPRYPSTSVRAGQNRRRAGGWRRALYQPPPRPRAAIQTHPGGAEPLQLDQGGRELGEGRVAGRRKGRGGSGGGGEGGGTSQAHGGCGEHGARAPAAALRGGCNTREGGNEQETHHIRPAVDWAAAARSYASRFPAQMRSQSIKSAHACAARVSAASALSPHLRRTGVDWCRRCRQTNESTTAAENKGKRMEGPRGCA